MFLNFEKETPDKYLVALVFFTVLAAYLGTHIQFLERLLDLFAGALITLLVGRFTQKQTPTVQAETIERAEVAVTNQPEKEG